MHHSAGFLITWKIGEAGYFSLGNFVGSQGKIAFRLSNYCHNIVSGQKCDDLFSAVSECFPTVRKSRGISFLKLSGNPSIQKLDIHSSGADYVAARM